MKSSFTRFCALLLLLGMMLSLSACSEKSADVVQVEPSPAPAPTEEPAPVLPLDTTLSETEQQSFIQSRFNDWAMDPSFGAWSYAVTDLDRNGRMEVIALSTQGTGHFSTGSCWELSEDFSALVKCGSNLGEAEFWPELSVSETDCYYDSSSDTYYYIFEDLAKSDAATYYTTKVSVSLKNGSLNFSPLCSKAEVYNPDGSSYAECYDLQGNLISVQDYDRYADMMFASFAKTRYALSWTSQGSGGAAVVPQPVQPVPTATAQPVGPAVVITKDPSSEALGIGGKTWFIAHANNAHTLTWRILSPEGVVYSLAEAMQMHPGLKLEALEGDTIAVSNVPITMNGWAVQARFDGVGNYQTTTPAYIYVGDFVTAYASVINKYKAFPYSSKTLGYAWENSISELLCYADSVGYALKDMDKDGIPELLIAAMGSSTYDKALFDLYTLNNGVPVQLGFSWPRSVMYLRTDNTVFNSSSGGAAYHQYEIRQINGAHLEPVECVFTDNHEGAISPDYYIQHGQSSYSPNANAKLITESEATAKIAEYEAKIYLPPLTKIY